MTIKYHSDTLIDYVSEVAMMWLLCHWKYECVLSHPIPWDVSHGIPIGMTFLWTSLCYWYVHQITIAGQFLAEHQTSK